MHLKRHTAISGTGRAGTTFLISLFHELGLDVGNINPNELSTLSYGGLELNMMRMHHILLSLPHFAMRSKQ